MNVNPVIINKIITFILPGITFLLGLIVKHYFDLFKNKIPKLKYNINKSFLGASAQDYSFGNVEILYNSAPVKNLYLCTLNLVNTSNKDFKDVEIVVWCDVDSMILVSHASKLGRIESINFTQKYIEEQKNINEHNARLIWGKRPYYFPVVNRDDQVTFSCLVTNEKGEEPQIYLSCDHHGLKIEANFVQPQLFWGENQYLASLWGLFLGALLTVPAILFIKSTVIVAIIAFILGAFCLLPGVVFLKLIRKVKYFVR